MASDSDRLHALKTFDDTKAGVKGLVDAGITTIPSIFHHPLPLLHLHADHEHHFTIPVIDLAAAVGAATTTTPSERAELAAAVKVAAETMGFFQVVNHGVPKATMSEMLAALRAFHEVPAEAKAPYYSRESHRHVRYQSNFDLFRSPAANWHDTLFMQTAPKPPPPEEIPPACRTIAPEYMRLVQQLGCTILELLSEALGLHRGHLEEDAACLEGAAPDVGHHRPLRPLLPHRGPPERCGGLQVLVDGLQEDDKKSVSVWVDVPAVPGALVVNIGDFRQLVSNGKFRSVEHRVVAKSAGPRVSVACFFRRQGAATSTRVLRPIVADGEAQYRSTTMAELVRRYRAKRLDGSSLLQNLRLLIHPIKTTS
uniref:1-aminocyclopropane-1-carboxylate oxidase-1-like protein n=1 Tax=Aegilops tauschii TaxID=37682 RepID=M8BH34_AEGTA